MFGRLLNWLKWKATDAQLQAKDREKGDLKRELDKLYEVTIPILERQLEVAQAHNQMLTEQMEVWRAELMKNKALQEAAAAIE